MSKDERQYIHSGITSACVCALSVETALRLLQLQAGMHRPGSKDFPTFTYSGSPEDQPEFMAVDQIVCPLLTSYTDSVCALIPSNDK